MKKIIRKLKRTNRFARYTYYLLSVLYLISYVLFAKNIISLVGIETFIRYLALFFFGSYFLIYVYFGLYNLLTKKHLKLYLLSTLSFVFIVLFIIGAFFLDLIYNKLASFNENEKVIYTSYLVTLNDTTLNTKSLLGMIDDKSDIEGNILANDIIKEQKLSQKIKMFASNDTDAYLDMLYALYEKEVDGIFVSSNYITLYSGETDFESIASETKVIYQASGEYNNADLNITSDKSLTEPFTALIMGVDSEYDGLNANAAFNGDTLILASFNPTTLSATLLSIPRDTFVPIACRNNKYAKINSSAAAGTSCVINTIENLMDLKIDYYAKINFKGVVELVEAVGGIEVEVEAPDYQFNHGFNCKGMVCEQNSDRQWGKHTIFIEPGWQTLNGEEALAYARCRGLYLESDLARNRHQQDIIMALANKMLQIDSYNNFKEILDAISDNIATNMSVNQILSSYNIFKDMIGNMINDIEFINIQKATLETYDLNVYLPSSGRTTAALGYYRDSLEDIIQTMKINLELEEPQHIKTFNYSINENYEPKIAGKGLRTGVSNTVLESFIGKTKSAAEKYCIQKDINCSVKYVDKNSEYYNSDIATDLIAAQEPHQGTLMEDVSSVIFYVNGATSSDLED
ncbi:MAG: LytR family transcriptional regulator [Firmicutes bacterium]|nr:LytR family transcriptional regulator [Bacillota bacterium]